MLIQLSMSLAAFDAKVRCWLMWDLSSIRIPRPFSAKLLSIHLVPPEWKSSLAVARTNGIDWNINFQTAALAWHYPVPATGLWICLSWNFIRFLSTHFSSLSMSLWTTALSSSIQIWCRPQLAEVHSILKSSLLTQMTLDIRKSCPQYWSLGTTNHQPQPFEPGGSSYFPLHSPAIKIESHQFDYQDAMADCVKDISVLKVKYSPLSSHPQVEHMIC